MRPSPNFTTHLFGSSPGGCFVKKGYLGCYGLGNLRGRGREQRRSEDRVCYKGQEEAHKGRVLGYLGHHRRPRRSEGLISWGIIA